MNFYKYLFSKFYQLGESAEESWSEEFRTPYNKSIIFLCILQIYNVVTILLVLLMKMTEGMPYYPGSQAYNWWARLSSTYAKGIPKGSNVNVFLNNPSPTGIWNAVEKPILQQRGINIIYR